MTDEQCPSISKNDSFLRPKTKFAKQLFVEFFGCVETVPGGCAAAGAHGGAATPPPPEPGITADLQALPTGRSADNFARPEIKIGNPTATHDPG